MDRRTMLGQKMMNCLTKNNLKQNLEMRDWTEGREEFRKIGLKNE